MNLLSSVSNTQHDPPGQKILEYLAQLQQHNALPKESLALSQKENALQQELIAKLQAQDVQQQEQITQQQEHHFCKRKPKSLRLRYVALRSCLPNQTSNQTPGPLMTRTILPEIHRQLVKLMKLTQKKNSCWYWKTQAFRCTTT